MGLFKYSFKTEGLAIAQLHDVDCSYKDLSQVLSYVKGKPVEEARKALNAAIAMTKPIPFNKFNTGMGHRSQLGGKKGKFPKKECQFALDLIDNAVANASKKGMNVASLVIKQASANKQNVLRRYRSFFAGSPTLGYGKQAMWANYVTTRAEIGLAEQDIKVETKKTKKNKKTEKVEKTEKTEKKK